MYYIYLFIYFLVKLYIYIYKNRLEGQTGGQGNIFSRKKSVPVLSLRTSSIIKLNEGRAQFLQNSLHLL